MRPRGWIVGVGLVVLIIATYIECARALEVDNGKPDDVVADPNHEADDEKEGIMKETSEDLRPLETTYGQHLLFTTKLNRDFWTITSHLTAISSIPHEPHDLDFIVRFVITSLRHCPIDDTSIFLEAFTASLRTMQQKESEKNLNTGGIDYFEQVLKANNEEHMQISVFRSIEAVTFKRQVVATVNDTTRYILAVINVEPLSSNGLLHEEHEKQEKESDLLIYAVAAFQTRTEDVLLLPILAHKGDSPVWISIDTLMSIVETHPKSGYVVVANTNPLLENHKLHPHELFKPTPAPELGYVLGIAIIATAMGFFVCVSVIVKNLRRRKPNMSRNL